MRNGRWVAVGVVAGVMAMSGVGLFSGSDSSDPLSGFCRDARNAEETLAGPGPDRAEALAGLVDVAPDDLADLVNAAAASTDEVDIDDMFVVPGDRNSDVKADVAADLFGQMATSRQAWDRVEQVLVADCELDLQRNGSGPGPD